MKKYLLYALVGIFFTTPSFATTVFNTEQTCAVCKTTSEYRAVGSTHSFGLMDLDTRPAESLRSVQIWSIDKCPKCGFINYDIEDEICPKTKELIQTSEYQRILNNSDINQHSNNHAAYAYLLEKCDSEKDEIMWSYIRAAWAADDENEPENAISFREKAISFFENPENELDKNILLSDLYRRTNNFDKAIQLLDTIPIPEECFQKGLIEHQKQLAQQNDNKAHEITPDVYCP